MLRNFLFGPREIRALAPSEVILRGLLLEPETVASVYSDLEQLGTAHIDYLLIDGSGYQSIALSDLEGAPDWQRNALFVFGANSAGNRVVNVRLFRRMPIIVSWSPGDPDIDKVAEQVISRLSTEGRPRVNWKRVTSAGPAAVSVLAAAAWLWFIVDSHPTRSLALLTAALLLLVGLPAWIALPRDLKLIDPQKGPGAMVRHVSRKQLRESRANSYRDIWVAGLGAIGALVVWLITALIQHYTT